MLMFFEFMLYLQISLIITKIYPNSLSILIPFQKNLGKILHICLPLRLNIYIMYKKKEYENIKHDYNVYVILNTR